MQVALLVKSHANARYAQSLQKLAALECNCLLFALNATAKITYEELAGTTFLMLEIDELSPQTWSYLSRHSALSFAAIRQEEWLKPIALTPAAYLEPDLAQVLKYKGKTNADFTAMMLHCARAASKFALSEEPLTVMDPVCGRGTSLFCALTEGDHAVGMDVDEAALHEADVYFERYLQYHRYKHSRQERSLTVRKGGAFREISFTLANNAESYKRGNTRTLRLIRGDIAHINEAVGTGFCHLMVGDLPYGVQHAPKEGRGVSSLEALLHAALPACYQALKRGGAIALAFNTYTLPKTALIQAMKDSGLTPLVEPPFHDFSHWVEQAVNRDMVVAVKQA